MGKVTVEEVPRVDGKIDHDKGVKMRAGDVIMTFQLVGSQVKLTGKVKDGCQVLNDYGKLWVSAEDYLKAKRQAWAILTQKR